MIYTILCEYAPETEVMATLHFNNIVPTAAMHRYEWFVDGTEGSLSASSSELTISFKENPAARQVFPIQGSWFPEAFGGSMGEMMAALAEGREPETSGRDNLKTLAIALAAVESAATGRAVELQP
jgi:predicted dehydrogenase